VSGDSAIGVVARLELKTGESRFDSRQEQESFSSPKCPDRLPGFFSIPRTGFCLRGMLPGLESNHSPAFTEWSSTSTLIYVFMTCTGSTLTLTLSVIADGRFLARDRCFGKTCPFYIYSIKIGTLKMVAVLFFRIW
jgi:hypothetical protein